jgi:hypothetical protein
LSVPLPKYGVKSTGPVILASIVSWSVLPHQLPEASIVLVRVFVTAFPLPVMELLVILVPERSVPKFHTYTPWALPSRMFSVTITFRLSPSNETAAPSSAKVGSAAAVSP